MLTINNILELYNKGVDIIITNKPSDDAGEWDLSSLCVFLYKKNIKSKEEVYLTLIHELMHARDDLIFNRPIDETRAEKEAIKTYFKRPYITELLKDLYNFF